jgi:hypothetical protein
MSDAMLVSTRKGLFTVVRGEGGEWRVEGASFVGDNVTLTLPDGRDGTWYAALDHGHFGVKVHRSEDRGETWNEVASPTYPEQPEGQEEQTPGGRPWPWSLKLIWALEASGADRPGELWCGTIPGALFRSRDRGDSWELVESLWNHPDRKKWFGGGADYPGIHSVIVDPRDSKRVLVGVSCGGVWETTDDGESWTVRASGMRADFMPPERQGDPVIQDVHRVVACPTDPDRMWTQHHCGIWKSAGAPGEWTEIEKAGPSTFGFAVAVHPRDPETAWFVPAIKDEKRIPVDAKVVVTRTRDGGRSFDVLTDGLPQSHAYDLVFRHALDIDDTGDRLAFGSTTGSLWVTEDQGDSWHTVSQHLPPVYAVRFV